MIDPMRPIPWRTKPSEVVRVVVAFSLFCFFAGYPLPIVAETPPVPLPPTAEESLKSPFEYQLENRPDPFVPFITEKAASSNVNMDEIVDSGEPLTGMQLFEPGQLIVVALLKAGNEYLAMVQDFTGKGYVLSQGMKIGRHGVVKSFTPQSVIVEETTVTRAGKKSVTDVVMLLKKEGER